MIIISLKVEKKEKLKGKVSIPGDKSISHRAVILSSLAKGKSKIEGFLESEDCLSTVKAFRNLGVEIKKESSNQYIVKGVGLNGLKEPDNILDCCNSGTTMRLMLGLLSAQNFYSILTGDDSLRARPMERIIKPLTRMGAHIWSREGGYAPLSIMGSNLTGIDYKMPVASAQVKSAILLAGLYSDQSVKIVEPALSRDHTERMLAGFGINIKKEGHHIILPADNNRKLHPQEFVVPGDISSAAFLISAGLITNNSQILIKDVGINPTRTGFLEVVEKMGGQIKLLNRREVSGEPIADIEVKSSQLHGIEIAGELIPKMIDEIPIIAVLASQADGVTVIKDAGELRVKETDRIRAIVSQLSRLGVKMEEFRDGMIIKGPNQIKGGISVKSFGDHRIAMSLAVAGLVAEKELTITNSRVINTSFPGFKETLFSLS
ncbi:MAG TPA: 3-phosphoshikimate 1-carboxyvinyltransferase [Halanaerobiales bacterium]|nr:3-phosphoshikimate 1-carboxyvinyltransferase [Halanaerobiales bacterium]